MSDGLRDWFDEHVIVIPVTVPKPARTGVVVYGLYKNYCKDCGHEEVKELDTCPSCGVTFDAVAPRREDIAEMIDEDWHELAALGRRRAWRVLGT